jgi:hypothetical protein
MSKKLFHGSCLCGKVTFEASIDLGQSSQKCNCTFCRKSHLWGIKIDPSDFTLLSPITELKTYTPKPDGGHFNNFFCATCSLTTHRHHNKSPWAPESIFVNLCALNDISLEELNSIPVTYLNGKADTWTPLDDPAEIKTL